MGGGRNVENHNIDVLIILKFLINFLTFDVMIFVSLSLLNELYDKINSKTYYSQTNKNSFYSKINIFIEEIWYLLVAR